MKHMSIRSKRIICILPCLLFILFSLTILIRDKIFPDNSASLKEEKVMDAEGRVILQKYSDEAGNPALKKEGYASIETAYEVADGCNVVTVTYLGLDGKPVMNSSRYAIRVRTYNKEGKADTDTYYDADRNPVVNRDGFHVLHREYSEDGTVSKREYRGLDGKLTRTRSGYAYILRYYRNGQQLIEDYYYDPKDEPVAADLGAYGIRKEYDEGGRRISTTWLDASGNPMKNNNGYAICKYEYTKKGKKSKELYFDAAGNPTTGGSMQYGIRYENGQEIYLDRDGNAMFRLDRFLKTHPFLAISGAILLLGVCLLVRGKGVWGVLAGYLLFILMMTILYREPVDTRLSLNPFTKLAKFAKYAATRQEVLFNIWLFVPLGMLLGKISHKPMVLLVPLSISLLIEGIQYAAGIGFCDMGDVMNNTLGGILGFLLVLAFVKGKEPQEVLNNS